MELEILFKQIVSSKWPSAEQLVTYLLNKHGYGGEDGYYGVTYADDLDEGKSLPSGYVEINYYDGGFKDAQVLESEYIDRLKAHLISVDKNDLLEKIRSE